MSNPISQLSGKPDLMRPVSVRLAPRVQALSAPAAVTELSPASSMPPVGFDSASDTLETAFPSLEVITRRILRGMQDAMDKAIEDAAREAIEVQRLQDQADAAQQAQREADLEDALASLSENTKRPTSKTKPAAPVLGAGETEAAPVEADLVGVPNPTGDGVEFSRPGGRSQSADIVPGLEQKSTLSRDQADVVVKDVAQSVRQTPRVDVERVHRPENLAYSALLLNG